jgi:hypothetical protein
MANINSSLNKLQKNLFDYMKDKALSYESEPSEQLKKYSADQKKFSKREFFLSSLSELIKTIEKSDIVYLGDFHTFDQSSRNMERLLRTLINTKKNNLTLGVEFVHTHNQNFIDQYLNNFISEHEFLESIEYRESWHFPWNHYRFFFQMAKKHNLQIIALNSIGELQARDHLAAEKIDIHFDLFPETTLLILFGELHIVPDKLPALVTKKKPLLVQTIIHQNLDEVFWKLKEDQRDNQIIKYNDLEFSIQSSPPWVKYESMIYWYENLLEDPEFEIHEYVMDSGLMTFNSTVFDTFTYITEKLSYTFSLDLSREEIEDFNLYDHSKMDYLLTIIESLPIKSDVILYKKLIGTGKSFKIPGKQIYYCSNYSINRISYLSGLHLQNIVRRKSRQEKSASTKESATIRLIYQFIIAYFSSKVINPYRKCDLYQDLLKESMAVTTTLQLKKDIILSLAIIDQQLSKGESLKEILKNQSNFQIYRSARLVSYFLGDVLFDNFYKDENKKLKPLLKVIFECPDDEIKYDHFKWAVLPLNHYKSLKKRFF